MLQVTQDHITTQKMTKLQENKVTLIKIIMVMEEVVEITEDRIMDGAMEIRMLQVTQDLITTLKMIKLLMDILQIL